MGVGGSAVTPSRTQPTVVSLAGELEHWRYARPVALAIRPQLQQPPVIKGQRLAVGAAKAQEAAAIDGGACSAAAACRHLRPLVHL